MNFCSKPELKLIQFLIPGRDREPSGIYLFIYLNIQFTKMINLHATIQPISSYENGSWSQENSTGALNRFMHNILVSVYILITLLFNPLLTNRFTDAIVASFNRLAIVVCFR